MLLTLFLGPHSVQPRTKVVQLLQFTNAEVDEEVLFSIGMKELHFELGITLWLWDEKLPLYIVPIPIIPFSLVFLPLVPIMREDDFYTLVFERPPLDVCAMKLKCGICNCPTFVSSGTPVQRVIHWNILKQVCFCLDCYIDAQNTKFSYKRRVLNEAARTTPSKQLTIR